MNFWCEGINIWLRKATAGGFFLVGGMNKILAHVGTPNFQLVGDGGVLPVQKTLTFRLLLLKQTTYISRVLTKPKRWHIMLFSQSALIPQLCLHFFQKLKFLSLKIIYQTFNLGTKVVCSQSKMDKSMSKLL